MHSVKIHIDRDGILFVGIFALITLILAYLSTFLGCVGFGLTLWCAYFFRDPDRMVFQDPHLILSPADGVVDAIQKVIPPAEWGIGEDPCWRVSIFLSIFDVHVNRIPCQGTIRRILYHPGKFLNATLNKASEDNERNVLIIDQGPLSIACVQIAGFIARRIRCDVQEGQLVAAGQRLGMIRFGSRVDVYLPEHITPSVVVGQTMIGGETLVADIQHPPQTLKEAVLS